MALFENFPYTNLHELNLDWIVKKFEKFSEIYDNLEPLVEEKINKYIEDHPDYNVHDNSLTSLKLNRANIPFYNVTDYGILPNTGDVYMPLHDLIAEQVYHTGGIVYFPKGLYTISYTVFIPENTIFIGDGDETEIYFDETDKYMGTGIGNAGSNIAIMNMKLSQLSRGSFSSGPQPGCIGFGNGSKELAIEPYYTHRVLRQAVSKNFLVYNITFDGFYPVQIEPWEGAVENVAYINLTGGGCCSLQANSNGRIENVFVSGCNCDVFRIIDKGTCRNIEINNVTANSLFLDITDETANIIFNNFYGTTAVKNNLLSNYKYVIGGIVTFNNCVFNEDEEISYLIAAWNGIHTFNGCRFNCNRTKFLTRQVEILDNNNYLIMQNCMINNGSEAPRSSLVGYGCNNIITGNIDNRLYGNAYKRKALGASLSSTIPSFLELNGDSFYLRVNGSISSATLKTLPSTINLPLDTQRFMVLVWNSNTPNVQKWIWAKMEGNVITVNSPGFNPNDFDTFMLEGPLQLTRIPTPKEVVEAFD